MHTLGRHVHSFPSTRTASQICSERLHLQIFQPPQSWKKMMICFKKKLMNLANLKSNSRIRWLLGGQVTYVLTFLVRLKFQLNKNNGTLLIIVDCSIIEAIIVLVPWISDFITVADGYRRTRCSNDFLRSLAGHCYWSGLGSEERVDRQSRMISHRLTTFLLLHHFSWCCNARDEASLSGRFCLAHHLDIN